MPVSSLVDHIADWLALPPGRWVLLCDGQELGPHDILSDLDAGPSRPVLELKPAS
mgnify:FL=1